MKFINMCPLPWSEEPGRDIHRYLKKRNISIPTTPIPKAIFVSPTIVSRSGQARSAVAETRTDRAAHARLKTIQIIVIPTRSWMFWLTVARLTSWTVWEACRWWRTQGAYFLRVCTALDLVGSFAAAFVATFLAAAFFAGAELVAMPFET